MGVEDAPHDDDERSPALEAMGAGRYFEIVAVSDPLTLWKVAETTADPGANPVRTPTDDTCATAVVSDVHFATAVTSRVEPSVDTTVAVSWLVLPTFTAATPVTFTVTKPGADTPTGVSSTL